MPNRPVMDLIVAESKRGFSGTATQWADKVKSKRGSVWNALRSMVLSGQITSQQVAPNVVIYGTPAAQTNAGKSIIVDLETMTARWVE